MEPLALAPELIELLDRSPVGVTIVSVEGTSIQRLYTNAAGAALLGYSVDEIADLPPLLPVVPEDRARLETINRDLNAGREIPTHIETAILRKDGSRLPVEIIRSTVARGPGRFVTMAILTDLTDRLRAQEALRSSEARFRSFAEHAPEAVTVIARGRMVYANPVAVRILGFDSAEALCARPLAELVIPDEVGPMIERMRRVARGERVIPTEYHGRRQDGSLVSVEIHSIAIEYQGEPANLAIGRDVSERKRLQAELLRADRMATIGLLAASVAHEINNPLSYVLLNLDRLHRVLDQLLPAGAAKADALELLADAREGGQRVSVIVHELLRFSRPDADVPPGAVDVVEALESAVRLADSAVVHRARLLRRYEPVPAVLAHSSRLTQVFLNLVVNAAQAFERPAIANEIELVTRLDRDHVVVEVSDNGPGIPAERLAHIFDAYFTTKAEDAGNGLGLTVSRAIVEGYGGRLDARSLPGGGTTLAVRLRSAP